MVSKIYAATLVGLECKIVDVEVDYRHGLSHFAVVGLGDKSVQESKERIISAIKNSNAEFIPKRVIVNLAPADMPKSGPIFDLSIATGYLVATGQIDFDPTGKAFIGELALDGRLRPVRGVLAIVDGLKTLGFSEVFLPYENASEAALVEGIRIYPLTCLNELLTHFQSQPIAAYSAPPLILDHSLRTGPDLADVKGMLHAKRALEIVAAGGHNILLCGVPGAGKTYLAKCLPDILPPLTLPEALEVTKIYSIGGLLESGQSLITQRPFRNPHHTSSRAALVGGGSFPLPGEITLANRGILFLDEFPEFSSACIEALRQPLEDKQVQISRANARVLYPAQFVLVAAMNPCKCGNLGDRGKACICSPRERISYQRKISSPILDRIDMRIKVDKLDYSELVMSQPAESTADIKLRVNVAREIQNLRFMNSGIFINAEMEVSHLKEFCKLDAESRQLLKSAMQKFNFSARAYTRILKVARTIADLGGDKQIARHHVAEALSYRQHSAGLEI